jgi:hypothetical protein
MPMTPLAALIVECQRAFEQQHRMPLTFGDIARRSHDALTRGRVQQLATGEIRALPSPATLRGLSLGIGAPYSAVLQRALESAGYLTAPLAYLEEPVDAAIAQEEAVRVDLRRVASNERVTGQTAPNGLNRRNTDVPS